MSKVVGILGYPLRHSLSPIVQQAALDCCGLDVRYESWECAPAQLQRAVARLRAPDCLGANITVPHKEAVIPLLDALDPLARQVGAVNTIVAREGRLTGHNTDVGGFLRALREDGGFDPRGKAALLLGAGGVARAVAFGLAREGLQSLVIVNRTESRARELAAVVGPWLRGEAQVEAWGWDVAAIGEALGRCDVLVNCTSIGMRHAPMEGQSPLAASIIPRGILVCDLVYHPAETPLLQEAQRAGARTLGGLPMLIYQGTASFSLWTGREAPLAVMWRAAQQELQKPLEQGIA